MTCDHCGRHLASLPYTCKRCGKEYCTKHRLPEAHECIILKLEKAERAIKREEGENVGPWFKDEFRLSNVERSGSGNIYESSRKRDSGDVEHDTEDRYRESHARKTCTECEDSFFEGETIPCRSCGNLYCRNHIKDHVARCRKKDSSSQNLDKSGSNKSKDTSNVDYGSRIKYGQNNERKDTIKNFKRQKSDQSRSPSHDNPGDTDQTKKADSPYDQAKKRQRKSEQIKEAAKRAEDKRYPVLEPSPDLAPDGSLVYPDDDADKDDDGDMNIRSGYTSNIRRAALVFISVVMLIISLLMYGFFFHT